jgi:RHS repeat-associated protein
MTGRRMVRVSWIIVASVGLAASAAAAAPANSPAPGHGLAIQAPGSQGWLTRPGAIRSRQVAYHAPVPRDHWRVLSTAPGVTLNPVTAAHATGAALNWPPYVNKTGDPGNNLASYQVHRSQTASFVPSAATLVAPVAAGVTRFTDTSATPSSSGSGTATYYMVAVKTKDGSVIPGKVLPVRLPSAGNTTRIISVPKGSGGTSSTRQALARAGIPADATIRGTRMATAVSGAQDLAVTYTEPTAQDTYYVSSLPDAMASGANYTVPVTLTNTTTVTWDAADWVLSYHWLLPDGTDVSASSDQAQTALPADMAPGAVATVNATVTTPSATETGTERAGYQIAWDLFDKATGTWLSSGTSAPALSAPATAPTAGTVPVLAQATSVQRSSSDLLGLEQYFQYTGVSTGSGAALLNNDDTGNVVWNYNAFSNPSRGFQTFVRLDYNSMDTSESSMGFGWSLQASTLMRLGTPLEFHPQSHPTTVTLTDGDGTTHTFTLGSDGTWVSPPGLHYYLRYMTAADCPANGKEGATPKAWLMTAADGTQFWFDCEGYQTAVVDKNGNEADFTYTQSNSNNAPTELLDSITDPSGRETLTFSYYNKGDDYQYVDDSTGDLVSATGLTDPDIIGMVKSITAINGRTLTFYYDTKGLMSQMTDGDGSPVTKTFKFGYDMTQGNKNVKLVSVTDPRGDTTDLTYYTAPQDPKFKWSLETITDRLARTTSFAYTEPSGGGIQAVVTDPKGNATTYLMDTSGRPVQSTNALSQTTTLAWDSDNNVTSLTEPNGAHTTWTYDANTGYPLTTTDAQASHDGTAATTYAYQTSLDGHVADLISELTPQQRLWTFGYDADGNLTSVTKPLGNTASAAAGSYTTEYTYDSSGDLLTSTDPDGNVTSYGSYDPSGYPGTVTVPTGNPASPVLETTNYTYDAAGNVIQVKDPLGNTTTQAYDVFGRPGRQVVPKTSTVSITTPAPVYDGNDNVVQSTAANGAVTTYVYNADDELASQVTPPDTSSSPSPTTTYTYDPDGNLATQTSPNGNLPGATAGSYTTTNGYDAINELTSVTDPMGGVTKYAYDDAGDQVSSIDPDGNQTQYAYDLNHQVIQTTDAAGNATKTAYDLDGNVVSTTDQNGDTTLYTLDADGQVTQVQAPAQAPGAPVTYDTTQYTYDQDGQQTEEISPRGVASGITGAFTTQYKYDANGQVSAVLTPYNPDDPVYNTPAETDYTYNGSGELTAVSSPPSGDQTIRQVTNYGYFDNGWVQSETSPTGITTNYDYNELGEQASRVLTSAGGAMSRTMNWDYYPDGNLSGVSDDGVPTGLYAEVIDDSDAQASQSPKGSWTPRSCTSTTPGCEEYQYQEHAPGTGNDTFTWALNAPASGNYTVYVKYPVVSGAATNAQYTVSYNGGSQTATVSKDQTQDNGGNWISLGTYALTAGAKNQTVSLAENSGGIVVADAVQIVRDNSADTNVATHGYGYTYDADGNQIGITDSSHGATVNTYVMAYDQDDRNTSVTEENVAADGSISTVHATTYGYDAASNLTAQTHDGAPSSYDYNSLNELVTETDAKSSSDTDPQVTKFAYNPAGQVASVGKPNGNTVTSSYYANELLYQQTEKTSGGTLVSSHQHAYDPDGNQSQDMEQLQSADSGGGYLSHTLTYTYDPMDQVDTVTTDGTVTESYTHDANNNVTSQAITDPATNVTTTTDYGFNLGQLQTVSTGGTTASYNYDPFGRLDTVTADGQTIESNTYDGFDNITATSQFDTSTGGMDTTTYDYDSLNRQTSQTTSAGTSAAQTTSYAYLGLSPNLVSEQDPGGEVKTYDYTPGGQRLSQDITGGSGPPGYGYYSYNSHNDVEAVTGSTGDTTATYGYTAYGAPIKSMFSGQDENNATSSPTSTTTPYNSYRFNAMRWDSTTGQYDMGFRTYDPGLNQFLSRDMYDGALANTGLTTDPFTGSPYAFGAGNPVTNIEYNGHMLAAPSGGGGGTSNSCPPPELTCGGPDFFNAPPGQQSPATPPASGTSSTNPNAANAAVGGGIIQGGLSIIDGLANFIPDQLQQSAPGSPPLWHINLAGDFSSWWDKKFGITPGSPDSMMMNITSGIAQIASLFAPGADVGDAARLGDVADAGSAGSLGGILRDLLGGLTCGGGESFTAGTRVLLASGQTVAIAALKPGDKVLATSTKTGKTQPETVTAVLVRRDTDLYDLKIRTGKGTALIETTRNHLFWDLSRHKWDGRRARAGRPPPHRERSERSVGHRRIRPARP